MLFPMYTVAADVLLKMTRVEPHEVLKAGIPVQSGCDLEGLQAENHLHTTSARAELCNPHMTTNCLFPSRPFSAPSTIETAEGKLNSRPLSCADVVLHGDSSCKFLCSQRAPSGTTCRRFRIYSFRIPGTYSVFRINATQGFVPLAGQRRACRLQRRLGQGSVRFTPVAIHGPPGSRFQADAYLTECFEAHPEQLRISFVGLYYGSRGANG